MPTFRYKAYRADGKVVAGAIEAETLRDATLRLKRDGLLASELVPADQLPAGTAGWRRRGIGLPELTLLTRRLATLLAASVPLYEAVTTLLEQEKPGELQQLLGRLRDRLAEGAGLAKALALEPRVFSESYVSMVAAGEASGALDLVLSRLADFLDEQAVLRSKVSTALAYPLLMVVVGSGVMFFLLAFVVPKITAVFADNKAVLPFITVALLAISRFLQHWWWLVLLAMGGVAYLYRRLATGESFRLRRDRWLLRLPFIGPLRQQLVLARFARILGLLLASGVPVVKALEITGEAVVDRAFRTTLAQVTLELIEGGKLSASLGRSPLFPPLMTHMLAVGEQSGTLEAMLEKAGAAYEREFATAVARATSLLEPLLVLGMGVAVGFVVVAVLLPIFQLNQLIK